MLILFSFSQVQAEESKATTRVVYDLVLKAYEVVNALGEESFAAFNDSKAEFVYKDTNAYIMRCPSEMMAHPFAVEKLKGADRNKANPFTSDICSTGAQPGGGVG